MYTLDTKGYCVNKTCWTKTFYRWADHRNAYLYTCMSARERTSFQNKSQILVSNQRKINKSNTGRLSKNSRTSHHGFPELSCHIKTWKMLNQLLPLHTVDIGWPTPMSWTLGIHFLWKPCSNFLPASSCGRRISSTSINTNSGKCTSTLIYVLLVALIWHSASCTFCSELLISTGSRLSPGGYFIIYIYDSNTILLFNKMLCVCVCVYIYIHINIYTYI